MQSDTATVSSGPPLSPFSSATSVSGISGDATSDEAADLGNFGSVWRALQQFRVTTANTNAQPVPVYVTSASESEDGPRHISSLSWNHYHHHHNNPSPSFIASDDDMTHDDIRRPASEPETDRVFNNIRPGAESTRAIREQAIITLTTAEDQDGGGLPSLGDLDIALGFIAAEKARLAAQLDARSPSSGAAGTSLEVAWKHVVEPKRKRRRRRKGAKGDSLLVDEDDDEDPEDDVEDVSSSPPRNATPIPIPIPIGRRRRHQPRQSADSSSSPSTSAPARITVLQRPLPTPPDPRLQRLRTLARKLRTVCPKESDLLRRILLEESSPDAPYIDPRGPEPMTDEVTEQPLVHVFVDHSNILVGFLSWIKRQPSSARLLHSPPSKSDKPRLSHPALVLILERGRAVSKRVLVASSPLHQDLDPLAELEYEVSVLQRVAVVDDNEAPTRWKNGRGRRTAPPAVFNSDGTSTESDPVVVGSTAALFHNANASSSSLKLNRTPPVRLGHRSSSSTSAAIPPHLHHSSSGPIPTTSSSTSSSSNTPTSSTSTSTARPVRFKYREQAVDELLQLKLLQALLDTPSPPPPGSTIVLATGDGASSQFNSDGFKGCVRKAVERGWMVELVAWEGGLSRSWLGEFGEFGEWFSILELDQFAEDLVDG